jgi:leucyl aminopeptidase
MRNLIAASSEPTTPIWCVNQETWPSLKKALAPEARAFCDAMGFAPKEGKHVCLPDASGALSAVLFGAETKRPADCDAFLLGKLATALPPGLYRLTNEFPGGKREAALAALGWLLSDYAFSKYKAAEKASPQLMAPPGVDVARLHRIAEAIAAGRDLINTPANDLGPAALEEAAVSLANRYRAKAAVVRGERLLKENFPLIHAVGRAADQEPRLVDFVWGAPDAPKVTLVGKGVCFDTGGLDLKPASAMALMKKDMAGAAVALALAQMIMDASLRVRLRVLLPIVENAVAGASFRPGDVYPSRKGHTIEIGNTDAEGRLILADALTAADEENPDLLFDFATLTGAARVALGPELPPFFTHDEALARDISACAEAAADPVWRLPLWQPYDALLDSKIASFNNISSTAFAGSIVAALFLARFVGPDRSWAHFDIYGWNPSTKPGRPEGGEAQTARLLFDLIEARYGADAAISPTDANKGARLHES